MKGTMYVTRSAGYCNGYRHMSITVDSQEPGAGTVNITFQSDNNNANREWSPWYAMNIEVQAQNMETARLFAQVCKMLTCNEYGDFLHKPSDIWTALARAGVKPTVYDHTVNHHLEPGHYAVAQINHWGPVVVKSGTSRARNIADVTLSLASHYGTTSLLSEWMSDGAPMTELNVEPITVEDLDRADLIA